MPAADSFAARETHVTLSETAKLRLWTLTKVPLLFFLRPSVVEATDRRCVIRVPLTRRSRNHLGSMYFGAFCAGADLAGGLSAMRRIEESGRSVSLVFKALRASFFKRAEGDVLFACDDGEAIAGLVRRAIESGEREELPVRVLATVPEKLGSEPVAEFLLTLSLKRRD
jgi:acyl-coenzyme A thioesterase PaaI-like protein